MRGKEPTVVAAGSDIKVSYNYKPARAHIAIEQFQEDDKSVEIVLQDGVFQAPKEKGIYYYGIFANWLSPDGKYSEGDTSSVFVIGVQ
ncbi:hypothetical protein [Paenibacillus radicis (ex Gao et al. 2016)]|uniref:Uncharacterized protein n=1 Tax=Paenibacillus radicis (ex Gao et al. 2016) TaxID=1737354 RepID=A0A917GWU1_9BACL|nr:hypothetical protein [Paenibacillus radicis (ex Gao et al. 2016)]GGG58865.1 hypothetical protein GCM10010918_10050 [Paenibacillus radicis (ex Gao et al. 2016)]